MAAHKALLISVTTDFLISRCRELGFIPQVTATPPHNRFFPTHPRNSPTAIYVKLFGHNTDAVNGVQARWGLIDAEDLGRFGSLGEDNLTLTPEDKVLLTLSFLTAAKSPHARLQTATAIASQSHSLQDLLHFLERPPSERI